MWDTVEAETGVPLSHDLSCPYCAHPLHTQLPCGDACDCPPVLMPGSRAA